MQITDYEKKIRDLEQNMIPKLERGISSLQRAGRFVGPAAR